MSSLHVSGGVLQQFDSRCCSRTRQKTRTIRPITFHLCHSGGPWGKLRGIGLAQTLSIRKGVPIEEKVSMVTPRRGAAGVRGRTLHPVLMSNRLPVAWMIHGGMS